MSPLCHPHPHPHGLGCSHCTSVHRRGANSKLSSPGGKGTRFDPHCSVGRCLFFQDDRTCFQRLPGVARQTSTNTEAIGWPDAWQVPQAKWFCDPGLRRWRALFLFEPGTGDTLCQLSRGHSEAVVKLRLVPSGGAS